jgi:polysaccharide transporter, PST family
MTNRSGHQALRVDHLQADLAGRSMRGGAVTVGALGFKIAIQFGTVIILSRLLPPQAFGILAMVVALTEFLEYIKEFGLSTATIQKRDITHDQVSALFWMNATLGVAVALVMVAAAPLIALFYGQPELTEIARWLAVGFVITGMSTQHSALLARQMRFNTLAVIGVSCEVLGMVAAIAAALAGADFWSLVVQRLVYCSALSVATWTAAGWCPGRPRRCPGLMPLLVIGGSMTGSAIINNLGRVVEPALIGWWWGALPLGLYERSHKLLMSPMNTATAPIYSVGMPALSRLDEDTGRYRRAYLSLSEKLSMATVPAAALTVASADLIVAVMLGAQWREATAIVAWLGIAAALSPVGVATGLLFITQGRAPELLKVGAIGSTIGVISAVIGLPFGAVGVAAGLALSTMLVRVPLCFWFAGRKGPVTVADLYASVMPSLLAAGVALASVSAFRQIPAVDNAQPIVALILCSGVGFAATAICFCCIPRSRRALQSILDLVWRMLVHRRAVA